MAPSPQIQIDLRQALLMIARTLDYVGMDDINHGHRVAYIAYECARKMGWQENKARHAYYTGLIHDCGVSSTSEHNILVSEMQPELTAQHCIRGYEALTKVSTLASFATAVRYHHTPWVQLKQLDLSEEDKAIAALVFLSDRLDFLRAEFLQNNHHELITLHEEMISETILAHSGKLFPEEFVAAMDTLIHTDGFWYNMDPVYIEMMALADDHEAKYLQQLDISDINQLAQFIARIVDAKSAFTYQHSERVALLSKMLAEDAGLSHREQELIYVAGLLHDIGKLRTPDEILNKHAKLTKEEYSRIRRHTVDTQHVLQNFFPNSKIGNWASNHHERLDGSGYPYNKTAEELDLPSRIIAVADIFQALSQKRPYRGRLPVEQVLHLIQPLVDKGQLDQEVFRMITSQPERYYQAACELFG